MSTPRFPRLSRVKRPLRIVIGLLFMEHGLGKLFGFPSAAMLPQMFQLLWFAGVIETVGGLLLVLGGGLAYTLGAITYARRKPDPFPRVLGYHEVFHVLTIVAAGLQYAAIAFYVLPRA